MTPGHVALAVLVAFAWALNFIVVAVGLHTIPPFLLLGLRFVVAALPILVLPRPTVSWPRLIALSATIFVLQFGFLFSAMAHGMSAGTASVILQSQAVFTPIVAAIFLGERPTKRQVAGIALAVLGMGVVGSTTASGGITIIGVALTLAAAMSWAAGNIQLRAVRQQNMLAMMVWMSLIPPLPAFGLSLLLEGGPHALVQVLAAMGWREVGVILYIVVVSTYIGHGGWAYLLKHYSAATIAPFALLVPIFAAALGGVLLGEAFGQTRLLGMGFVLAGLAVIAMPSRRAATPIEAS